MRVRSGSISSKTQATTTGSDGADVINQAFGVVGLPRRCGRSAFEPEVGDAVVMRELEFVVNQLEQARARGND